MWKAGILILCAIQFVHQTRSTKPCPIVACKCPYGVYYAITNGCKTCGCKARCPGNFNSLSITCGDGILRCPGNYTCITHPGSKKGMCCPIGKNRISR